MCAATATGFSTTACSLTGHKAAALTLSGATSAFVLPLAYDAIQEDKKPSMESAIEQGYSTGPNTYKQHEITETKLAPEP
jgi:hypothetical protein